MATIDGTGEAIVRIEAMGKDAALLRLSGIHKRYRHGLSSIHALCDIHMQVDAGEMVAVCAPFAHGKTTLLNLIGLLEPPSAGRVLLDGVDAAGIGERDRIALRTPHRCRIPVFPVSAGDDGPGKRHAAAAAATPLARWRWSPAGWRPIPRCKRWRGGANWRPCVRSACRGRPWC